MTLARRLLPAALLLLLLLAPGLALAQSCPPLPAGSLVAPGKLMLSINPTLPPQQFIDAHGELQGLNVDLGRELGKRLCLTTEFVRMDFPAMIPALRAARFDGIDTGIFWTEERAKLMFMVPYAQQAIGVFALPDGLTISGIEGLAGHVVGVEVATNQERKLREASAELVAHGGKAIDLRSFANASEAAAALRAGQIEAVAIVEEAARSISKQLGMRLILTGYGGADITFAFRDKTVAEAVAAAFTAMRQEGLYDTLFDKWGLTKLPGTSFAIRGTGPV
jgi:polar amino acid transport system substrate-binding protein